MCNSGSRMPSSYWFFCGFLLIGSCSLLAFPFTLSFWKGTVQAFTSRARSCNPWPFLPFRASVPIEQTDCSRLFCPPLTFESRSGSLSIPSVPFRNTIQTSRGKYDRLPHTTAESTSGALDGYGLRCHRPARPASNASIRFFSIGSCFCSALPSDPASRQAPLRFATLHLHQVGGRLSLPTCRTMLGAPIFYRPSGPKFRVLRNRN
jgi:hypothetical protein